MTDQNKSDKVIEPDEKEETTLAAPQPEKSGVVDGVMDYILGAISDADEVAALSRVNSLRESRPTIVDDELANYLIKQKCLQTGGIGAVTSGSAIIPGLGTFASLTFGVAADIGMTFKLQAELVLEIAAVYNYNLSDSEKRSAIITVTGLSAGANQLATTAGKNIATKVSERLAEKSIAKAVPVIGVAASAGSNIFTTYIIGHRAKAYFSLGPEQMESWGESIRAISGVDERKIVSWLTTGTENAWLVLKNSSQGAAGAVIVAGQAIGEVAVASKYRSSEVIADVRQSVSDGVEVTKETVGYVGDKIGSGVETSSNITTEAIADVREGISNLGEKISDTVGNIGQGIADKAEDITEAVTGLFKRGDDENDEDENKDKE